MAKYFVFLDVDGVLTSHRVQHGHTCSEHTMWDKFDPVAVDFLNSLDAKHNLEFVLMSTWKNGLDQSNPTMYHWVNATFRNAGFRGKFAYPNWKTEFPEFPEGEGWKRNERAYEVKHYLEQNECDDFLLFDDSAYDFNKVLGVKRHVKTSSEDGMLHKHMLRALSLTGAWEKKK